MTSCDPAQTIEIENKSQSSSTIKFYFKRNDFNQFNSFIKDDSLILTLAPNKKKKYNFGIGTWEMNNSLDSLVSRVDRIEIISEKSTIYFTGKSQIKTFFRDRILDDRFKARIIIEVE